MTTVPEQDATGCSARTGFMAIHGNRLEDLRELLVQYLRSQPLAVLEPEVILLQSKGMKHWLELGLADDAALGVCAATRMLLPGSYLWQLYRQVLGPAQVPERMPFDKDSLLWRLMRLLPALCERNPLYAPLAAYLAGDNPARKRYQLALQIADVLDGYQTYRADWLADWAAGRDALQAAFGPAQPVPVQQGWQAQLWRDLRQDVGEAHRDHARPSVHARFLAALRGAGPGGRPADPQDDRPAGASLWVDQGLLPRRLIVFGVSSLSLQMVQALAAVGRHTEVLMLVHNPCQYYWGDLVEGHAVLRQQARRRQQLKPRLDPATESTHPLLASWGKQGRDALYLLDELEAAAPGAAVCARAELFVDPALAGQVAPADAAPEPLGPLEPPEPPDPVLQASQASPPGAPTQLAQLQSDILHLRPPPAQPQPLASDGSLCFVSAHSPQRELEVLHDRLLAWLDADPGLQPQHIMVMAPDMGLFAPHIHAVFGRFAPGQARHIPYSVADATPRQSPLALALERLLRLPELPLSLADWLAWMDVPALRQPWGLDAAGVRQAHAWLAAAGVRWGLDDAHRLDHGLPGQTAGLAQNTWDFGLRRLLLGYALGSGQNDRSDPAESGLAPGPLWQGTLAQPALGGLDAPVLAGVLRWLQAVQDSLPGLRQMHPPAAWADLLRGLVGRFFAPADDADERAIARLLEPLDDWLQACDDADFAEELPLDVVREHWLTHLGETGWQQRFFGGGVQFGTLMPLRAIPFQVVCLLGMNDGAYPRAQAPRDFDLMAGRWRAGDRSRREDDRYLFLEALLSARQKLYISWQGHSAADNSVRPPSVLVAQLLDVVNACWSPPHVAQVQPLQAFSTAYFLSAPSGPVYTTYAADWERIQPQAPAPAGLAMPVGAAAAPQAPGWQDLQTLLRQPVEVFFCRRLQLVFDELQDLAPEDEPFALDALQRHLAGAGLLQGRSLDAALQRLQAGGSLPLAGFGQHWAQELAQQAQAVRQARSRWLQQYPLAGDATGLRLPLDYPLPDFWRAAPGDAESAALQLAERLGPVLEGKGAALAPRVRPLTGLWLRHLAACAGGLRLTSVQLGGDGQVVLAPLAAADAQRLLKDLADVYADAWARPLPLACKTGWAYLLAERSLQREPPKSPDKAPKDPLEAAEAAFEDGAGGGERGQSPYLQRAFDSFQELAGELPRLARDLYGPLLGHARAMAWDAAGAPLAPQEEPA